MRQDAINLMRKDDVILKGYIRGLCQVCVCYLWLIIDIVRYDQFRMLVSSPDSSSLSTKRLL